MWTDGDCKIPEDPNAVNYPGHKTYSTGSHPRVAGYREVADYFGRLAAYFRSGGFEDECGKFHSAAHRKPLAIKWWGITNEGEHLSATDRIAENIQMYDAIIAGIRRFEKGGEAPMRYVGVNQNVQFGPEGSAGAAGWLSAFLNRSAHTPPSVPIDMVGLHGCE